MLILELQTITGLKGVDDLEYLLAALIVGKESIGEVEKKVIKQNRTDIIVKDVNALENIDDWLRGRSR